MPQPEQDTPVDSLKRSRAVMLGLFAMFIAPIVIAWFYSAGLLEMGSWGRTNRGILVTPPVDLREVAAVAPLFERAELAPGEWMVLYLAQDACAQKCLAALDRLTTIRSLLGYSGQRVKILALDTGGGAPPDAAAAAHANHLMSNDTTLTAIVELLAERTATGPPQIVFIDWRRQLALRFAADAASIDIKKDIKRLLRASKVR